MKNGFNNVIDAFHIVNNGTLPVAFYTKDYSPRSRKIILTDEIFKLRDTAFFDNFTGETEARWRLVETAWAQRIAANLLEIHYTEMGDLLYITTKKYRRKAVTSARAALNGYQKGKCFYCHADISIGTSAEPLPDLIAENDNDPQDIAPQGLLLVSEKAPSYGQPSPEDNSLCDVDHFFPHILKPYETRANLDGVWNLVLTCKHCNRGEVGKFAQVPALKYLERLHARNEYLIGSHHPLRETLMLQTGSTEADRVEFLRKMDAYAINNLIHRWETETVREETF